MPCLFRMKSFVIYNEHERSREMTVSHPLSCETCACQGTTTANSCEEYSVELRYADVCRQLAFDPEMPLFVVGPTYLQVPVLYPWDEIEGNQARVQVVYPDKEDFPTNVNQFAWVDVVHPMVRIPVHANQPGELALTQTRIPK
jgi:hypothetical protein